MAHDVEDDDPRPVPVAHTVHERRGCGKACFRSEGEARRSMRQLQRHGVTQEWRGRPRVYLCRACRAYHVGHSE